MLHASKLHIPHLRKSSYLQEMSTYRQLFLFTSALFFSGIQANTLDVEAVIEPEIDEATCTWNGFPLYGDIQIVDAFPDIKVQVVDAFPDLNVKWVDAFPDDCGEWKSVDAFPDVKIQFVDAFPDIKVKFVDAFPGIE